MLLGPDSSRRVLEYALQERFALLAINADSPPAVTDCLEAARICGAPVIIEASLWQLKGWSYGAGDAVTGMTRYLAEVSVLAHAPRYREVPVLFHTDHIKGPEALPLLKAAIAGLPVQMGGQSLRLHPSTVSVDSSDMTEEENVEAIRGLAEVARANELPVVLEMEAGVDHGVTDLEVARRLLSAVEKTHPGAVCLWAPGVGTQHGFSDKGYPAFSVEAVEAHQKEASAVAGRAMGIALHGSSGVPEEILGRAVRAGVVKVNWSSESLLLRSQAAREFYVTRGECLEKKHPDFKNTAMDNGVQTFVSKRYVPKVVERMRILGGEGKGPEVIRVLKGSELLG